MSCNADDDDGDGRSNDSFRNEMLQGICSQPLPGNPCLKSAVPSSRTCISRHVIIAGDYVMKVTSV
jgi:hypothetical protein